MIKLSILDQSPVPTGSNSREAIEFTVKLAQEAEKLGYTRFWVSEHHDTRALAGSTPEVLITHLAAKTKTIRSANREPAKRPVCARNKACANRSASALTSN